MMLRLLRALSLILMATSATALGQSAISQSSPFTLSAAVGPTRAFRGVDALGVQVQGGIALGLRHGFGLRLEGTGHWYEEQPQYPCLVQDAVRCYQTMRRVVGAGIISATYHLSDRSASKRRTGPYVISGLGVYRSRRTATRYSDCQPVGPCDRGTYKLELRDTQLGWSGGIGADFGLGTLPAFAEARLHYVYRDSPAGQPTNDYFLWPLSFGFRF